MEVRWITAFIDRPAAVADAARGFWAAVTESSLSPTRGAHGEFATLVPSNGDAHLRVQRVLDGAGGGHVDLHVDDPLAAADDLLTLGAGELTRAHGFVSMRSPGGLAFCLVAHHGESVRASPAGAHGHRVLVDQLSIDIASELFEVECDFWAAATGWPQTPGHEPAYRSLCVPAAMPLRVLLQQRGDRDAGRPTECHLDLACDDVEAAEREHLTLGAVVVERFDWWTVMFDPSGMPYCLTRRSPDSGLPSPEVSPSG